MVNLPSPNPLQQSRFGLGTFSLAGCPSFPGLVIGEDRVVAVEAIRDIVRPAGHVLPPASSVLSLIECWPVAWPALQAASDLLSRPSGEAADRIVAGALPLQSLKVHPPIAARQIFMSGANYFKHVVDIIVDLGPGKNPGTEGMNPAQLRSYAEALMRQRQRDGSPYVFNKPVSTMAGAFDPVVIPSWAEQPDWELELAVVIAAPARHVSRDVAMQYVAGYMVANDITNRDWIYARAEMKPLGTDWLAGKSCPGYLPIGPYIVPAAHVQRPMDLRLQLKLNGEVKQDDSTADMIFDIARLIEHISNVVQLLPGDIICTGSPAGNGTHFNRYLRPGDVIDASITGLGSHRNLIISNRT